MNTQERRSVATAQHASHYRLAVLEVGSFVHHSIDYFNRSLVRLVFEARFCAISSHNVLVRVVLVCRGKRASMLLPAGADKVCERMDTAPS